MFNFGLLYKSFIMEKIVIDPIGVIHSPYKNPKNMPIQGRFKKKVEAFAIIKVSARWLLCGITMWRTFT